MGLPILDFFVSESLGILLKIQNTDSTPLQNSETPESVSWDEVSHVSFVPNDSDQLGRLEKLCPEHLTAEKSEVLN